MRKTFRNETFWIGLVLILAAFLYLWEIKDRQYFSYDQARDYLIVKRILVDKKLTLIGPSIGIVDGAYLPPLYYYLLTPALMISKFHLWGPDVLSALFGVLAVLFFYLLARDIFGFYPAVIGSLFFTLNPFLIQAARHARNPHWLPVFVLLLAISFKRYYLDKKRNYLFIVFISLAVGICLHPTAIVFLPVLVFLSWQEFKNRKTKRLLFLSILVFTLFFLPVIFFDLRHGFLISKALLNHFLGKGNLSFGQNFLGRITRFLIFLLKIPIVFFSGTFKKELLSLRSMPISSLEKINLVSLADRFDLFKLVIAGLGWLIVIFLNRIGLKSKQKKIYQISLLLVILGFGVNFLLPLNYSYFYYFYNLFPFLLLLLSGALYQILRTFRPTPVKKVFLTIVFLFLAVLPLLPGGLKTEIRSEKYFLPACEIIAEDLSGRKAVIAGNNLDQERWEHNGLEYRYFLETTFKSRLLGVEVDDYRLANVLYFIDESKIDDPLKFRGMEMEAFGPGKIEANWQAETGQKIYKMGR